MEAQWAPTVPAKLDAAFCCGLAKALQAAAAAASADGSAGASPPALPTTECMKLLKAAEKLLKAEPTLVHVSAPSTQLQVHWLAHVPAECPCKASGAASPCFDWHTPPGCRLLPACMLPVGLQADPEGAEVVVVGDLHGQYQDLLAM